MANILEKPSTPLSEHSEKSKKYDRQLRLWGDHGQASLEASHVCLINACATGLEVLKSLVLPGVGAVTIVDNASVSAKDLGNNFFVNCDSIGQPRGDVTLQNLLELNSDVRGTFVDENIDDILSDRPYFFDSFSVVVACNITEKTLLQLSSVLWSFKVPLVVARSYGMIGYVRIQVGEHTVVESHPDNNVPDLRLDRPFPSLQKYVGSLDIESMDDKEHSHVPYGVLLMKYLTAWKEEFGEIPQNYKQKKEFIKFVKKYMREKKEPEQNFEEAFKAVNVCVSETKIPPYVKDILEEASNFTPSPDSKIFWILAKALQEFVATEGNGFLPVSGVIPDMTADSEKFIQLQNIYREQAAVDADWVQRRVQEICHQLAPRKLQISESEVKEFCKNSAFLRIIRGKSITEEYDGLINLTELGHGIEDPECEIVWYVMLRAVDQFYNEYRAYPGYFKEQVETDIARLKMCVNRLLNDWGCGPCVKDDFIHEMCRYGAAELHSIAAFVGGCAAQEIIKLLTRQYIPISNTFIYHGGAATSATYCL